MFLDLEELFVQRDQLRALQLALFGKLTLGVSENFFAMSEEIYGHCHWGESPS